jgi:hypothetical protein
MRRNIDGRNAGNVPGQRPRHRILRPERVDADAPSIDDPVTPAGIADDVVVEERLHDRLVGGELLGVRRRPNQTLLFAKRAVCARSISG